MPALLILAVRISIRVKMAFQATFALARDRQVRAALPWRYIRRLPRQNAWVGIITASLAVSCAAIVVALAAPVHSVGLAFGVVAVVTSWLGVNSSWIRTKHRNRQIRK